MIEDRIEEIRDEAKEIIDAAEAVSEQIIIDAKAVATDVVDRTADEAGIADDFVDMVVEETKTKVNLIKAEVDKAVDDLEDKASKIKEEVDSAIEDATSFFEKNRTFVIIGAGVVAAAVVAVAVLI